MQIGANVAFCLVIFGLLAVYAEFASPGRILPGVAGAAAAACGAFSIWRAGPSTFGVQLLAAALLLFLLDAVIDTRFVAGLLATLALAAGFCRLIQGPKGISPFIAIPWCGVFGAATVFFNYAARRARANKRSDLSARQ